MKKFKWDKWDYDLCGEAYVIAKDECPNKEDVPGYIVEVDMLPNDVLVPGDDGNDYLSPENVVEGWCKFQVRSDWADAEGPSGGYLVNEDSHTSPFYKHKRGWFPVWIVRIGGWY